jgi:uncharacterized membrane protein
MGIKRIGKHLFTTRRPLKKAFPDSALAAIEQTIRASEEKHRGQIRVVIETALDGSPLFQDQPARERAIDVFSQLRIWDTEQNNGVMIYLLLADHKVEIVADRGIDKHVGADGWQTICRQMENSFKQNAFEHGMKEGIDFITTHLVRHFPADGPGINELPDRPVVIVR